MSTSPTLCLMRASATVQSVPGPWWRLGTKILVCMVFQTLSIKYHILIDKINSKTLTIVAQESWSFEKWNSYSLPKSGDSNSVKLSSEACDPCQGQVPMGIFRAHSRSHTLCLHPAFWLLQILIESPKSPPIRMEKVTWLTEWKFASVLPPVASPSHFSVAQKLASEKLMCKTQPLEIRITEKLYKVGPRWKILHFKGQNWWGNGANKVGGKPSSSSGKSLLVLAPMPGFPGKYDQPQRSDHQS